MAAHVPDAPAPLGERLATSRPSPPITAIALALHGLAAAALFQPFDLRYLALMAAMYVWFGLSVALYLHRSLSHKSLVLVAPLRVFFAVGAAVGLAGDPLFWVGMHRRHHAATDGPGDPHTPRYGAFFAHMGWVVRLNRSYREDTRAITMDVREDAICRFLEPNLPYLGVHVACAAGLWAWLGWPGLLWCLYVPLVANQHAIYAVNSLCHMPRFGRRDRETRDDSRNVWWLAIPTLGESYHNHHHADPRRARHGQSWREPDLTALVIWVLEKLRLARQVAW